MNTRRTLFKLRMTWNDLFPYMTLYALDREVKKIDPAWSIVAMAAPPLTAICQAAGSVPPVEDHRSITVNFEKVWCLYKKTRCYVIQSCICFIVIMVFILFLNCPCNGPSKRVGAVSK